MCIGRVDDEEHEYAIVFNEICLRWSEFVNRQVGFVRFTNCVYRTMK